MHESKKPFFLGDLNESQYEAATNTEGPLLILAGAGSGKTKTIVARVANIIYKGLAKPENVLVLTFTNKAAKEMRERGKSMLKEVMPTLKGIAEFSTFHSWGLSFLKKMHENVLAEIGLKRGFTIADDTEKEKIVKSFLAEDFTGIKIKIAPLLSAVSKMENDLAFSLEDIRSKQETEWEINELVATAFGENAPLVEDPVAFAVETRKRLKEALRNMNMLDFDDMITLPYLILKNRAEIRKYVQNKYKYLMVDEFQDTNVAQLKLLVLMVNPAKTNICVVGDDFQSIYGWRGAQIENILGFHGVFKKTKIVNLKINYRSCTKIVHAGNCLLENAEIKHEHKEPLVPFHKDSGYIEVRKNDSVYEEVEFIADKIEALLRGGTVAGEIAVLARVNQLLTYVENEFIKRRIPYKIYGAKSFLERKFIKECLSYFKFLINPSDMQFENVLRGFDVLTERSIGMLKREAAKSGESLFQAAVLIKEEGERGLKKIGARGSKKEKFASIISQMEEDQKEVVEDYKGFVRYLDSETWIAKEENAKVMKNNSQSEKALANLGMMKRLSEIAREFESLEEFLEHIYLSETESEDDGDNKKVSIMSIHKSKGLEFENVFVMGFADNILPIAKSIGDLKREEEERRLAYVAITRAKKRLYITFSTTYPQKNDFFKISRYYEAANLEKLADFCHIG